MKKLFTLFLIVLFAQGLSAQVRFRIALKPDGKSYDVYLRPDTTWNSPLNFVPSSQLSMRVPTGGFQIGTISNKKGQWTNNAFVKSPQEAPAYDYLAFALASPTNEITFEKGKEVHLFSFQNIGSCTGKMLFIDNKNDPFLPPNSQNVNIGNQISVAAAGQGVNAYHGPFYAGGNDCAAVVSDCGITYNGFEFSEPSTCGVRDAWIRIFATTDLGLPLQYSIDDGRNWQSSNYFPNLAAGDYHIWVRDIASICLEDAGIVNIPGPLGPTILGNVIVNPDCGEENGSITINARSDSGDPLEYSINDGTSWQTSNTFEDLGEGTYYFKVRNTVNGCIKNVGPFTLTGCQPTRCLVFYELEIMADGRYRVSMLSDTTWSYPNNITSNMQVTIKAPAGGLSVSDFRTEVPGVTFDLTGSYFTPMEDPASDYFTFGLMTPGTSAINFIKGRSIPLFSFANVGGCSGDSLSLMENDTDPFLPPNSQNGNVGQQLSVFGYGSADLPVCLNDKRKTPCRTTPVRCLAEFSIEQLQGGAYRISMTPDTTLTGTNRRITEMRITVKVPTGGFMVGNLNSLISGVSFNVNGTFRSPNDEPNSDYFNFELSNIGTDLVTFQKGQKVHLFTFENVGTCSGGAVAIMDPESDPFRMPNSDNATVGLDLKVTGLGADRVPTCLVNMTTIDCPDINISIDTVYVTMPTDQTEIVCLGNLIEVPNGIGSASICADGIFVSAAVTDGDDCVELTPLSDFHQVDQLCVVHCDANIPSLCDTTIVIICPEVKVNPVDPVCRGTAVPISLTGGAGVFTWSPAQTLSCGDCLDPVATPAATTTYTVTANDGAGCLTTSSVTVVVLPDPVPSFTATVSCSAQPVAFSNTTSGAGNAPSWDWDFGDGNVSSERNPTHNYGFEGTYTVTLVVTTADGCSASTTRQITVAPAIVGGDAYDFQVCEGQSVQLDAQGGVQYSWTPSTGLSNPNVGNPTATPTVTTTYLVQITDANGCGKVDTFHVQVVRTVGGNYFEFEGCRGQDINLSASTGNGYTWVPGTGLSDPTAANPVANLNASTTYLVSIVNASGCTSVDTVQVHVISTVAGNRETFSGCKNEDIQLSVGTGTTYSWTPTTGLSDPTIANPVANLSSSATYLVAVADDTGCSRTDTVVVNVVSGPIIIDVLHEDPVSCDTANGSIKIFATDGGNAIVYSIDCGQTWQTSNYFPGLGKGSYCVKVRSMVTGCITMWPDSIILVAPTAPAITDVNANGPSACGAGDGQLVVEATGSGDFEYSIDGIQWQDSPVFENLSAGDYYVWVRLRGGDAACEIEYIGNPVIIEDPQAPSVLTPIDSVFSCEGISKQVTIEISEDILGFTITGGGAYTSPVVDGRSLTFSVIPASNVSNYIVDIQGVSGCSAMESFKLFKRGGPNMRVVELSHTICGQETGFFLLLVNGDNPPFKYDFSKDGTPWYEDETLFGNSQPFSQLGKGFYTIDMRDELGCQSTLEVEIKVLPINFGLSESVVDATCDEANGRIEILNPPSGFTFEWVDVDTNFISDQAVAADLTPGQYRVTITDTNTGCFQTKNYMIQSLGGPIVEIQETLDIACAGESSGGISFLVAGNGQYTASIPLLGINQMVAGGENAVIENLPAGWYWLVISDGNNCQTIKNFNIKENPITPIHSLQDPSSCLESDGGICLILRGGVGPYTVTGDAGNYYNIFAGAEVCLENLAGGIYEIRISDASGCERVETYELVAPDMPAIDPSAILVTDLKCPGDFQTGAILSNSSQVYEIYTGNGNFLGTTPMENLSAGNYRIVYKENGCEAETTVRVNVPDDWDVIVNTTDESCEGNDGSIVLEVAGANGNYNFDWADGINNIGSSALGLHSLATYNVTITDQSGCRYVLDNLEINYDCDDCDEVFATNHFVGQFSQNTFEVCLPLRDSIVLDDHLIYLNGQLYEGPIRDCSGKVIFYNLSSLLAGGVAPYQLEDWDYGLDKIKDFRFQNVGELISKMNLEDPLGNWKYDPADMSITGGALFRDYGDMSISYVDGNRTVKLKIGLSELWQDRQSIEMPGQGYYLVVIQNHLGRCADSLIMDLKYKKPKQDTIGFFTREGIPINEACLELLSLTGNIVSQEFCGQPENGTATLQFPNCVTYVPFPLFVGTDTLCVEICDDEDNCEIVTITVEVGEHDLIIHNGFSPNEDGINDFFHIENIELFPDNKIIIFNRWGNRVYQNKGYTNDLPWKGDFDDRPLPDGSYFYILEDGTGRTFTGFLHIQR